MEEIWKPVRGWEGLYEVSNLGGVRSLKFNKTTLLIPNNNGHDYFSAHLRKVGINKMSYIHRLVAEAFIPNPENKPCVNHKDNNRSNNNLKNLEWVTIQENSDHRKKQMRHAHGENSNSKLNREQVLKIRGEKTENKKLAIIYKVSVRQIKRIKRKETWSWL